MLRRALERLSRGKVLKRRLSDYLGGAVVHVSPDVALKFWFQGPERAAPELFRWARELVRPGDVIWDVGANQGLFSFAAASAAGPTGFVLAIEPDPWLASLIRATAKGAPSTWAPIEVLERAVTDRSCEVALNISARGRAANFIDSVDGSSQSGGSRSKVTVAGTSLDDLMEGFPRPSFVKIDVEGAERMVFEGARLLIATAEPRLLAEVTGSAKEWLADLLTPQGYRFFDADRVSVTMHERSLPSWNTFACVDCCPHDLSDTSNSDLRSSADQALR